MEFCQSCGMPMTGAVPFGTNADQSKSEDYCSYCFVNGSFITDMSMDEMINFCVPHMIQGNPDMDEAKARKSMEQFFPTLKRWK